MVGLPIRQISIKKKTKDKDVNDSKSLPLRLAKPLAVFIEKLFHLVLV